MRSSETAINRRPRDKFFVLLVACVVTIGALGASSLFAARTPAAPQSGKLPGGKGPGLRFGIYPGGGIGSVNETLEARPEDAAKKIAALTKLSSGSPFVVHLYSAYTGLGPLPAFDPWLNSEIAQYTAAGFDVELVARYRPDPRTPDDPIGGFSDYVRSVIERYGSNPGFVSLQVTNEANLDGSGDASDGAYASSIPALVRAISAAGQEVRASGAEQVKIGFNWAYESSAKQRRRFWNQLGKASGSGFASDVDWVGLNSYPGTWAQVKKGSAPRRKRIGSTLISHLKTLRRNLMPRAGLGAGIPINVTENGWPTGPGRSESAQARFLKSMVGSVARARERLNVSDYRWFDLRDGNSADSNFENHYGLTDDAYRPKKAFDVYRKLIAKWSDPE